MRPPESFMVDRRRVSDDLLALALGHRMPRFPSLTPMNAPMPLKLRAAEETLLADCTRRAVTGYLSQMGGHPLTDLYATVLTEVERPLLEATLAHVRGNQSHAAQILGLSRGTLRKKLLAHHLIED